jgi:hypothetical protein
MSKRNTVILFIFVAAIGLLSLYFLYNLWPSTSSLNEVRTHNFGLFTLTLNAEVTYLLIVSFAAVLGSFVHTIGSMAYYKSQNNLRENYLLWYFSRPFVGAGLALAIYFAVRGGLLSLGTSATDLNVYGIAGVAAIIGMFSDRAADKLRDVADALLKAMKPKKDEGNISE